MKIRYVLKNPIGFWCETLGDSAVIGKENPMPYLAYAKNPNGFHIWR